MVCSLLTQDLNLVEGEIVILAGDKDKVGGVDRLAGVTEAKGGGGRVDLVGDEGDLVGEGDDVDLVGAMGSNRWRENRVILSLREQRDREQIKVAVVLKAARRRHRHGSRSRPPSSWFS